MQMKIRIFVFITIKFFTYKPKDSVYQDNFYIREKDKVVYNFVDFSYFRDSTLEITTN